MAAFGRHHKRGAAAFGRGTSFVVSFEAAMNRVDVDDLVVDLVVDLVDIDLDVDFQVDFDLDRMRQECFRLLSFEKCCIMH